MKLAVLSALAGAVTTLFGKLKGTKNGKKVSKFKPFVLLFGAFAVVAYFLGWFPEGITLDDAILIIEQLLAASS